ncbi:hypothetical protein E1A91_D02G095400v1 [Gossypium mustelinum]|uniref:THH1/TOM1/TOM3 domain-containing protein n=1 Tax=Gossypium mustelinum TaxID=34275 RepID=A0A5D2VTW4_GOSMU|nr:hypothetical protein E1A91_D02G095400v1 [Gossypium mustelinum]
MRVPEYGWTTQKVFHFLNFLVNGVRALVFVFRRSVQNLHPEIAMWLILWWKYIPLLVILSKMFFAGLSLFAALGFLQYGGRLLFYALQLVKQANRPHNGFCSSIFELFRVHCSIFSYFCKYIKNRNLSVVKYGLDSMVSNTFL